MDALISSSESCSDLNSNACISLSANVYSSNKQDASSVLAPDVMDRHNDDCYCYFQLR